MRHVLLAACVLAASPAAPQDYLAFRSPSGNIHCSIVGGDYTDARCDILEYTPSFGQRPADCDLDWGYAFAVGIRGASRMLCAGDTMIDPQSFVLDYGRQVDLGGITCTSLKTGMTCTNRDGHGFQIARARQELF